MFTSVMCWSYFSRSCYCFSCVYSCHLEIGVSNKSATRSADGQPISVEGSDCLRQKTLGLLGILSSRNWTLCCVIFISENLCVSFLICIQCADVLWIRVTLYLEFTPPVSPGNRFWNINTTNKESCRS